MYDLSYTAVRILIFRIAMAVNETAQRSAPRSPTSGTLLAVFGSFVGAGSAAAVSTGAAGAGVGGAETISNATSAFGACGGGGAVPVLFTSCAITISGSSTTF